MSHLHVTPPQTDVSSVPFLDIARENSPLEAEFQAAMLDVTRSGAFVLGPECVKLERQIAELVGVRHAVGCASGSDALLLALMALDIGPGDEVLLPSFTFFATASAVWRLGAKPVFVDIDPRTYNIDPNRIEEAITRDTRAIIPVHLFGQPADMEAIQDIATRRELFVVEDAAQSIGAALNGRAACAWGHIGCLSFYPTKNLGGCGDGGMMLTDDDQLAERLELFRAHGMKPRYVHREVGINSRLDSLQAAVLNIKLQHLAGWTAARQTNAADYDQLFNQFGVPAGVELPVTIEGAHCVWNQYTIRVSNGMRDALRQYLRDNGVGSEIYYPIPLHRQSCFSSLGWGEGSLPETERAAREVLSIPIFPQLTAAERETVVRRTLQFFKSDASRLHDYRPAAA